MALVEELSFAAGTVDGMIGGQVTDIEGERQPPTAELLDSIHRAKTGALLRASVRMGGIAAGGDAAQIEALSQYGEHVGLAFQIVDDILDVEESSEALGKTAGKDAAQGKITFPAVYGLEASRGMAQEQCAPRARGARTGFGDSARRLHEIADLIVHRKSVKRRLKKPDWIAGWWIAASPRRAKKRRRSSWPAKYWSMVRKPIRPARLVSPEPRIEVRQTRATSSRGGLKLEGALEAFRYRRDRAGLPPISVPPQAASPIACCSTARRASMPSTSAPASSTGSCAAIRASSCTKASTPEISN